ISDQATPFSLATGPGDVLAIELDGSALAAHADLALGETTVNVSGTDLDLAGASGSATLSGATLPLDHVALGDHTTTTEKDGRAAVGIDLNPDDGRVVAGTIAQASGVVTIAAAPRLDLQHMIDHAVLGDAAPIYDVARVLLVGALTGIAGGNQLEVAT